MNKVRILAALLVMAGSLTAVGHVHAAIVFMHGWQSNTSLYSVDTVSGTETLIGSSGLSSVGGLSFDSAGTLFGIDRDSRNLYTFDLGTAAATLVGNTGLVSIEGLSFASDGNTLYASGGGTLYSVNKTTGAASSLGSIGLADVDGLTVASTSVATSVGTFAAGTLFAVDTGRLYAIDAGTLAVTSLGPASASESLAFAADGSLFGHDFYGSLYEIDLVAMSSSLVASTSGPITGLASMSTTVPEPAAIAVWSILGLVGIGLVRRRRRNAC